MLKRVGAIVALTAAMGLGPASADETKADRASVDHVMAQWAPEARADAERLIARYGLPDRVTDTILIWDVRSAAQQQAMLSMANGDRSSAEAGEADAPPR